MTPVKDGPKSRLPFGTHNQEDAKRAMHGQTVGWGDVDRCRNYRPRSPDPVERTPQRLAKARIEAAEAKQAAQDQSEVSPLTDGWYNSQDEAAAEAGYEALFGNEREESAPPWLSVIEDPKPKKFLAKQKVKFLEQY